MASGRPVRVQGADDVTEKLRRWSAGDAEAIGELLPTVYAELRRLARRALSRERWDHTLQPTALVNEAFLRLVPQQGKAWANREHFFSVCAQLMRQVLVDHARRRRAKKRGPKEIRIELDEGKVASPEKSLQEVDLVHLDRALEDLARIDPRRTRVVEMRYFAGMTVPEIAAVLGVPEWDVKKDWTLAKTWLKRRLKKHP
jgi:RNA polymerase sigma factor (TIGR02999 family)